MKTGYVPLISYNTQIKISGQDITLRRYEKRQLRGYGRKDKKFSNADIIPFSHEGTVFSGMDDSFRYELVENFAIVEQEKAAGKNKTYSEDEKHKRFIKSVYRAKETIYDIIACNVGKWGKHTAKFVTLTFRENISDIKAANAEFTRLIKDLNYYLYGSKNAVLKYVCIPELQERGAWHFHVLFFNLPLVPVNFRKAMELCEKGKIKWGNWMNLQDLWGMGFVGMNSIKHSARVAAYVTKYLTKGIEFTEDGQPRYKTEGPNNSLKRLSDYDLYKRLGLENMKRFQASKGLYRPHVYHIAADSETMNRMIKELKENDRLLKLDKSDNKINTYEGHNEYRGNFVVKNFRLKQKYLDEYVQIMDKLSNKTREKYLVKLNAREVKKYIIDEHKELREKITGWHYTWLSNDYINSLPWGETVIC